MMLTYLGVKLSVVLKRRRSPDYGRLIDESLEFLF